MAYGLSQRHPRQYLEWYASTFGIPRLCSSKRGLNPPPAHSSMVGEQHGCHPHRLQDIDHLIDLLRSSGQSQQQQPQQDPQRLGQPMEAKYESWLKAQGITGQTLDSMRRHGISSRRVLAGLQPEDPADMGINSLGQHRLLQLLARECAEDTTNTFHLSQGGPGPSTQPASSIHQPQSGDQGTPPTSLQGYAGQPGDPLARLSDQLAALFHNPTSMAGPAAPQGLSQ